MTRRWWWHCLWLAGAGVCVAGLVRSLPVAQPRPLREAPPPTETLLRGLEHRSEVVESATGVMGLEVVASPEYLAAAQEEQQRSFDTVGRDETVQLEARDLAVLRFSYDEDRIGWQARPLTDSGCDWWGLGSRYLYAAAHRGYSFRLEDLRSSGYCEGELAYLSDGISTECTVQDRHPGTCPSEPLRMFQGRVVSGWDASSIAHWRKAATFYACGTTVLGDEDCVVVAAIGNHDPPKGYRRLWVCPSKGFAVVRMEHVEVDQAGQPTTASLQCASQLRAYGDSTWLPHMVREDHWGFGSGLGWDFSKRFRVFELTVNDGLRWGVEDLMFPLTQTWTRPETRCLWDGGETVRAQFEPLVNPEPEAFGAAVLQNARELETWMTRPADEP